MTQKLVERIRSKDTKAKIAALSETWDSFKDSSDPLNIFDDLVSSNGTGAVVESLCVAAGDPNFRISQVHVQLFLK